MVEDLGGEIGSLVECEKEREQGISGLTSQKVKFFFWIFSPFLNLGGWQWLSCYKSTSCKQASSIHGRLRIPSTFVLLAISVEQRPCLLWLVASLPMMLLLSEPFATVAAFLPVCPSAVCRLPCLPVCLSAVIGIRILLWHRKFWIGFQIELHLRDWSWNDPYTSC